MKFEFKIEISGKDAIKDAKSLVDKIKINNLRDGYVELVRSEPEEGTLDLPEYLPLIMGAAVSASFVKGVFEVITTWMEGRVKREEIASNERIEANKLKAMQKKIVFRAKDKNGNPIELDFYNYDETKIDEFIKKIKGGE